MCCCCALLVGMQATELRPPILKMYLFIYLAPPSTGALVPGSEMIVCPSAGRWVVLVAQNIPRVSLLRVEWMSVPFCRVWGRGSQFPSAGHWQIFLQSLLFVFFPPEEL